MSPDVARSILIPADIASDPENAHNRQIFGPAYLTGRVARRTIIDHDHRNLIFDALWVFRYFVPLEREHQWILVIGEH